MAGEKGTAGSGTGNTAVPAPPEDRVAMLSLLADGTPDQTPGVQIIGDREFAEEATRRQFTEQAVSAVDVVEGADEGRHEEVAAAAEKAADAAVASLFVGDDEPADEGKAAAPAASGKTSGSGSGS